MHRFAAILFLIATLASCGDHRSVAPTVTAPSPLSPPLYAIAQPLPGSLVVFSDPASGFSTSDLRDTHERIVQLTNAGDLIWTPDHAHFPGYEVSPDSSYWGPPTYFIGLKTHVCRDFCVFSVRFGTRDGERRAYLTIDYGHSNPGTLIDVEVAGGALVVTQTALFPPGTPTLSGVVTEMTPTGEAPMAGVTVSRGVPAGWQTAVTDQSGAYRIQGLIDGAETVSARKAGYQTQETKNVSINGDTRFDIQLVRR